MDRILRAKKLIAYAIALFLVIGTSTAKESNKSEINPVSGYLEEGIYVVVGVFKLERNAIRFYDRLKENEGEADYGFYPPKGFYYVHIGKFDSFKEAKPVYERKRIEEGFDETWIYKAEPYTLDEERITAEPELVVENTSTIPPPEEELMDESGTEDESAQNAESDESTTSSGAVESSENLQNSEVGENENETETGVDEGSESESESNSDSEEMMSEEASKPPRDTYLVYFNTFRARDFKEVPGEVEIINNDNDRRFSIAESNKLVELPKSLNRSGEVQLICDIFGYKNIQHKVSLPEPLNDSSRVYLGYEGDTLVIDFELQRLSPGDVATMYNVYFFKDAAIMRPDSKYEIGQLLDMMKEQEDYNIVIHGHTNGNASGPIKEMAKDSKEYFSQSGEIINGSGSAKKLSQLRAEVIKRYLVDQGIDEDRMDVKGWGGKKMIYDKLDKLAYLNVRVEVEILEK